MPKVTCVLSSFNRPRLVRDAVESVLAQTMVDWELLIADDSSNDETRTAIVDASQGDPRVRFVWVAGGNCAPHERQAVSRYCLGINKALTEATGDYVCYLPDDDYVYPDSFRVRAAALDANPDVHVVYGRLRSISYDATAEWDSSAAPRPGRTFPNYGETDPETGRPVNPATWEPGLRTLDGLDHNQPMHRRCCLAEMGGPPWWPALPHGQQPGDAAFFARLTALGHQALSVDAMVATKRYHGLSFGRTTGLVRE